MDTVSNDIVVAVVVVVAVVSVVVVVAVEFELLTAMKSTVSHG
jgi:hypothetical protein